MPDAIGMNTKKMSKRHQRNLWITLVALLAAGAVIAGWRHWRPRAGGHAPVPAPVAKSPAATTPVLASASATNAVASNVVARMKLFAGFRKRPFAVAEKSADYQWTAEDGKQPDVIRQLAHNELEYERLAEENARILRRQLVYAGETADQLVQQSRLSGEPIRQFTLPGLDGKEFQVEISQMDLSPSGQQGTFSGHLAGRLDSMVTFAFNGGREAFTVLSPADDTYLVGEPREPGELVVKSINPATYVVGVCGNP